jgi:hypothetical protein
MVSFSIRRQELPQLLQRVYWAHVGTRHLARLLAVAK